jgi:hypothetical protein
VKLNASPDACSTSPYFDDFTLFRMEIEDKIFENVLGDDVNPGCGDGGGISHTFYLSDKSRPGLGVCRILTLTLSIVISQKKNRGNAHSNDREDFFFSREGNLFFFFYFFFQERVNP